MRFKRKTVVPVQFIPLGVAGAFNVFGVLVVAGVLLIAYQKFPAGVLLEVPRAVTSEYAQGEFQTIVIEADGTFIVNGRNADAAGLRVFLDQFKNRQDVIVLQADKKTSVDAVVGVMDLCRGRGLRRVMITTQK